MGAGVVGANENEESGQRVAIGGRSRGRPRLGGKLGRQFTGRLRPADEISAQILQSHFTADLLRYVH